MTAVIGGCQGGGREVCTDLKTFWKEHPRTPGSRILE